MPVRSAERTSISFNVPGAGEMGRLVAEKDWSAHPLGEPAQWPSALRILLGTLLRNKFPMFLFWGKELYCFYNDAFRPSLGAESKHPELLGMAAKEGFAEIWDTVGPMIQQVYAGGQSVWQEDLLIPNMRNGRSEDIYWTFSYSAALDEQGAIQGVLTTCVETTEKVQGLARLKETAQRLETVVQQAPVAVAIFTGPEHVVEIVNSRALSIWDRTREQVLGLPLKDALPELSEQGFETIMDEVLQGRSYSAMELPVKMLRNERMEDFFVNLTFEPLELSGGKAESLIAVGVEVTETVLAKQRAEAGEVRFRLLADSMPQFAWTGSADGVLNYFNKAVYDYSGLSESEVSEKGWLQIVHPEEREANVAVWMESISKGREFHFEHRFRRHDGEYRWQLSRALPLRDAEGTIKSWVGTSTDIQDLKEQELEKDFFIGMAGHELRNPLGTLRNCLDILTEDMGPGANEDMHQMVKIMDRQVKKLTHLVSDLGDVSKLKGEGLDLDRSRFDLSRTVRIVVEDMRHNHPEHVFNLHAQTKALVDADRYRIAQVLGNLLSNAVKYAPAEREVDIACEVEGTRVVVSVRDRGIGIPSGEKEWIFQRFYRVKNGNGGSVEGFGIGLYLVADIVKQHNGTIEVLAAPDKGSIFRFGLPLAQDDCA